MIDSHVARRYARALLALAGDERGPLEQTAEQLARVADELVKHGPGLLAPGAPKEQQRALVEALAETLEKPVADLLRLLVDRNRFDGLPQIAGAFSALVDEKLGRVRATVTSAGELTLAEQRELGAHLSKATGKHITLSTHVDPSLLGGLSADVGGLTFDGSLRTQLEKLRQELKAPIA